ncbi:MAG TPA: endonuclease/exonuclease/phosphatase family protein [Anaerolineales bacterium]|nr:endonuclease/exonuclease/phosphatase family protein [Anaerolineales bacterium]
MEISLITFNVSADFLSPPNVPPWDERKALCAHALRQAQPSIIGLQEAMPRQCGFFQSQLPEFSALTVQETTADETLLQPLRQHYGLQTIPTPYEVVLLFRTLEFDKIAEGYWWLSPTPDRLSVGFGNIAPRIVLWAQLRHRASGREFIVFNTHLDLRCTSPMVELCREKVAAFTQPGRPLIFMGDFNFTPAQEEYTRLAGDGWRDSRAASAEAAEATFMDGRRIDYIFYRSAGLTPQAWAQLLSPDPQRRLSDHDPVYARFSVDRFF